MIKHVTVLLGLTVLVFGTIFVLTSDWLFNQQREEATDAPVATVQQSAPAQNAGEEQAEPPTPDEETVLAAPGDDRSSENSSSSETTITPQVPDQAVTPASPDAAQASDSANGEGNPMPAADFDAILEQGEEVFEANCQACHGASGEGGVGPALAENANLESEAHVANMIIHGSSLMPPFGEQLDDDQIAAVANFVRNTWGNAYGPISTDTIAAAR